MKKQKRQFLILCGVLILFCGVFFGLKLYNKHQEEKVAKEKEAEKIIVMQIAAEDVEQFSYQYQGAELTFVKEEDTWYYREDKTIPIYQSMITTMLSNLTEVVAEEKLAGAEDLSQYGFDEPGNVIRLTVKGEEITFTIGMKNEITGQYYLMVSGDEHVYLVGSAISSAFQKSVEDLTEEPEEPEEPGEESTPEEE